MKQIKETLSHPFRALQAFFTLCSDFKRYGEEMKAFYISILNFKMFSI